MNTPEPISKDTKTLDEIWNGKTLEGNVAGAIMKALKEHGLVANLVISKCADRLHVQFDFKEINHD